MVVSSVGLEGPAPISMCEGPVFDAILPGFKGLRLESCGSGPWITVVGGTTGET